MTLRLPLLGKILGWLTLNLLFLVVAIGLLFMVEFPVDSLLLELMGDRPQRAADLLMAELRTRSHVDRLESLVRFSEVYGVEAILVRDDGLLANDLKRWVPEEVLKKVSNNPRRPSPDFSERPEERPGEDRPPRGLREGPPRGGFDQHRHLGGFLDHAAPAIRRGARRQHIDAGRQPGFDQMPRQLPC